MLDIFELSPIDEKDYEDIQRGIAEEGIRACAYLAFIMIWEEYKDEVMEFLNNKKD